MRAQGEDWTWWMPADPYAFRCLLVCGLVLFFVLFLLLLLVFGVWGGVFCASRVALDDDAHDGGEKEKQGEVSGGFVSLGLRLRLRRLFLCAHRLRRRCSVCSVCCVFAIFPPSSRHLPVIFPPSSRPASPPSSSASSSSSVPTPSSCRHRSLLPLPHVFCSPHVFSAQLRLVLFSLVFAFFVCFRVSSPLSAAAAVTINLLQTGLSSLWTARPSAHPPALPPRFLPPALARFQHPCCARMPMLPSPISVCCCCCCVHPSSTVCVVVFVIVCCVVCVIIVCVVIVIVNQPPTIFCRRRLGPVVSASAAQLPPFANGKCHCSSAAPLCLSHTRSAGCSAPPVAKNECSLQRLVCTFCAARSRL